MPDLCPALGESAKYGDDPSRQKADLSQALYEGENINIIEATMGQGPSV